MPELNGCGTVERAEQRVQQADVQLSCRRKLQENRAEMLAQRRETLAEDAGKPDPVESLR